MRYFPRLFLLGAVLGGLVWWSPWQGLVDAMSVADGYRIYRGDDYRLAYPENWQIRTGTNAEGHDYVEFNGPATPEGAYSGQVRVIRQDGWNHRLQDKLTQFQTAAAVQHYQIVGSRTVTIEGAAEAHRFEVVRKIKALSGASVSMRGSETFAVSEDGVLLAITAEAPEKQQTQEQLPRVLDTVKISGKNRFAEQGWDPRNWFDLF
ncbi:hypothetical protein Acsp04_01900 [Actinomadura sp. NBRC 104425]|uniref:hypothetical protein n=1 Tax=Actinomadura sp. NBRC 104425 TaxID=3032204 RepID=UPI0024A306D3|nr:hypothetical protein [Actinomadura sp. NBRC 104425]GLZ09955.1 hypothetical protein Acsp04_01900 [Actinomadura sp. NBRC 104425]